MPLINGQKMACEPCIRGHRSTKCTHANERLMVPVRKPGRPLSSCPHPSSKPCTCGAVTAAIPRKQKCSCGHSAKSDPEPKTDREDSDTVTTPPGDSKASTSNFRVQKSASRRGSTRKQSIDAASLERMPSSQLNIMSPYEGSQSTTPVGVSSASITPMAGMHPYSMMGMGNGDNSFAAHPMMFPMFAQHAASPSVNTSHSKPTGGYVSPPNGSSTPDAASTGGGCCGGGRASGNGVEDHQSGSRESSAAAPSSSHVEKKTKSCCSSTPESSDTKSPRHAEVRPQPPPYPHAMMMPPFQAPMAMPNGMYPIFPHPTVFTYPPQYGTYMQPLQPEQWRQVMAALSFGQPAPPNTFDVARTGANAIPYPQFPETHNKAAGTSHHCTCGEACQCVGCAAHPYNEATQNYVRSAWNSMMEDQPNGNRSSYVNGNQHDSSAGHTPKDTATPLAPQMEGNGTTSDPHTPSDGTSGLNEEQTLSANDFFFVSYPFGDPCAGDTASCPCGDDCQCIGCVIHNNPDPAQASEPQ